jgi:hypothetical protein
MTLRRSRAYGRVARALDSHAGLERMSTQQRDALRDAADTLVLATVYDDATQEALAAARALLLRARTSDCDQWVEQLATDLQDAGPVSPFVLSPAAIGRRRAPRPSQSDQPARR